MICYHHNDLDGRCAAAIVLKAHPKCRMREIDYKDDPDFEKEVEKDEKVFIVDFSFKPEKMFELLALTESKNIFWIDHHKTAEKYVYHEPFEGREVSLKGLRDFSTECKKSGCELTWKYLFPGLMPEAVRLLGDYDTWRFDTKEESMAFQFGMRSEYTNPTSVIWRAVFDGSDTLRKVQDTGRAIINYKDNINRRILNSGYNVSFENHICFVVNSPLIDSSMFDLHACVDEYDVFISWIFTGKNYSVSLRSRGEIDVGEIAKKYGGGGHKGASGFICDRLPF